MGKAVAVCVFGAFIRKAFEFVAVVSVMMKAFHI